MDNHVYNTLHRAGQFRRNMRVITEEVSGKMHIGTEMITWK